MRGECDPGQEVSGAVERRQEWGNPYKGSTNHTNTWGSCPSMALTRSPSRPGFSALSPALCPPPPLSCQPQSQPPAQPRDLLPHPPTRSPGCVLRASRTGVTVGRESAEQDTVGRKDKAPLSSYPRSRRPLTQSSRASIVLSVKWGFGDLNAHLTEMGGSEETVL